MKLKQFTESNTSRLLSTQSRRADLPAVELAALHVQMGQYLAYQILEDFDLAPCEIEHVQGTPGQGFEIADKSNICVIAMLRAGLYAAEGVRSVFKDAAFLLYSDKLSEVTSKDFFSGKSVIVVDAVINTGRSIEELLKTLIKGECKKIVVVTLVMQEDAKQLAMNFPEVSFYALRLSKNKYSGSGGTDTGNRLFNTKSLD